VNVRIFIEDIGLKPLPRSSSAILQAKG